MWLILALSACGHAVFIDDIEPPDDIVDTGRDTARDTGDVVARGGVRITYAWQDGLGVASCRDAGLTSLTVDPDDGRDAITFPCADAEIRVDDVKVGHHVLTVVGETSVGSLWRATAEIDVAEGATTDVPVVLACDENGVQDACGGG